MIPYCYWSSAYAYAKLVVYFYIQRVWLDNQQCTGNDIAIRCGNENMSMEGVSQFCLALTVLGQGFLTPIYGIHKVSLT